MDLKLASKLIKYNPQDVQSTVYVVEYAQHNYKGDDVATYINEHLKSNAQYAIAQVILAETALANTIKAKPSAASGKIDSIKEKPSTTGSTSPAMKSIEAKGDAKKVGFKGVQGTGTNVVQKEDVSYDWVSDVVEELGEDFDLLTDEDLENLIFEALEGLETEELLVEAVDVLTGTEVLMEAPSQHSAMPNVAVQAPQKKAAASPKASRMSRLAGAARKVGSAVKAGAKTAAKGAVRGAGYASGLAQRAASSAKREFSQGRERGLGGSSGGGSSSSNNRPVQTSGKIDRRPQSGGGSAPKKKAGPGLLSRAAGAVGRGLRKAVGAGAKAAGKVAVGGAKLAGKAAVGTAKVAGKTAVGAAKLGGKAVAGTAKVAGKTAVGGAKLAGKAVGKTAQAAGSVAKAGGKAVVGTAKAAGSAVKKTGQAAGNLGKKVIGKTSRAISKGSDKLARKLGEEQMHESRVDKVRRLALAQETFEHDIAQARNPDADSWRERLAYSKYIAEQPTPEQLKKREVLKQTKDLTNKGKHKEASELFKKNFPNFGK